MAGHNQITIARLPAPIDAPGVAESIAALKPTAGTIKL